MGWEGGVHGSNIGNWGYEGIFKSVYFLLRKRICTHKKHRNVKQTIPNPKVFMRAKTAAFAAFCSLIYFFLLVRFCLWVVFFTLKMFSKKKKQVWNCPRNLSYLYYCHVPLYINITIGSILVRVNYQVQNCILYIEAINVWNWLIIDKELKSYSSKMSVIYICSQKHGQYIYTW